MQIFELKVTQRDCPHINVTNKYPGLYILIMNTESIAKYQRIFSIFYSHSVYQFHKALNDFSNQELVRNFMLLSKKDNIASAIYETTTSSLFKVVKLLKGFRFHPIIAHKGIEQWFVLIDSNQTITENDIEDHNTSVRSMTKLGGQKFLEKYIAGLYTFNFVKIFSNLSKYDQDILRRALANNYFNWPRGIRLSELGKKLNLPKSTISYHIRKIEKEIAEVLKSNDLVYYHD